MHGPRCVGGKIAEVRVGAHPDFARIVQCQRADHAGWGEDFAPGDPVVFQNGATRNADVQKASAILENGPRLGIEANILGIEVLDDRQPDLCAGRGRVLLRCRWVGLSEKLRSSEKQEHRHGASTAEIVKNGQVNSQTSESAVRK